MVKGALWQDNRRQFLKLGAAGAGLTLLSLGRAEEVGLFFSSRDGYQAWSDVDAEHGLRALVGAGILAANPHNSQPWTFRLTDSAIDVSLDVRRALGPVDPFLRQMHVGMGCAIENILVAATAQDLTASARLFPDPSDPALAAQLTFTEAHSMASPHVAAIGRRHTNRGPYASSRKIDLGCVAALESQVLHPDTALEMFDATSAPGEALSKLILESTQQLLTDTDLMRATDAWFRWTPREVHEHRDGPSLACAGLSAAKRIVAQLLPRPSSASYHRSWLTATRDVHLATAASFGVISVRAPVSPTLLVEAGRLWQRIHLEGTLHGLGMQPLDQWLELVDRARQRGVAPAVEPPLALNHRDFVPIMMFRAGIPLRVAPPSARRALEDVLLA